MLSVECVLTFLHALLRNFGMQILVRDFAWQSVIPIELPFVIILVFSHGY